MEKSPFVSACSRFGKYEKPEQWHDRSWKLHVVSSSYATRKRGWVNGTKNCLKI